MSLDPLSGPTAYALADLLIDNNRHQEALSVIQPLAQIAGADHHLLTAWGGALKGVGRLEEARSAYARAAAAAPASAVAEHNLASVLGDLEDFPASVEAARRAFAKGLDAPETWLVLARALLGTGDLQSSEDAYREVIRRRPNTVDAQAELAQLIWMRTGDVQAATKDLDFAIRAFSGLQALRLKKGELLQSAGDVEAAYEVVAPVVESAAAEPMMHVIAARFSSWHAPERALRHALDGVRMAPQDRVALSTLCEAWLACGEPREASRIAESLHNGAPLDQHAIALLSTAWRLMGDPRYARICDYKSLVQASMIEPPNGWSNLQDFLRDLTRSLTPLHRFRTHPVGQSVRHGSQTSERLTRSTDPVIKAFFAAIDRSIRAYIASLGSGGDPLRSRVNRGYQFNGEWSVRLASGGFHAGHVHPMGWISSAFYVSLPPIADDDRKGWLQFGEPGLPTRPTLGAEHFVRPQPGQLVLFPSYVWHSTVPFSSDQPRLSIAFDIVPD